MASSTISAGAYRLRWLSITFLGSPPLRATGELRDLNNFGRAGCLTWRRWDLVDQSWFLRLEERKPNKWHAKERSRSTVLSVEVWGWVSSYKSARVGNLRNMTAPRFLVGASWVTPTAINKAYRLNSLQSYLLCKITCAYEIRPFFYEGTDSIIYLEHFPALCILLKCFSNTP